MQDVRICGGNPISRIDPPGLWSVEVGGYVGIGGSVSAGRDAASGSVFLSLKLGKGLGAVASWEPLGGRPGGDESQSGKGGVGVGFFCKAGGNAGPVAADIEANLGRNFFGGGDSALYGGISPKASIGSTWGIGAGAAAGIELSVFKP